MKFEVVPEFTAKNIDTKPLPYWLAIYAMADELNAASTRIEGEWTTAECGPNPFVIFPNKPTAAQLKLTTDDEEVLVAVLKVTP
jgi:hypothetical protein